MQKNKLVVVLLVLLLLGGGAVGVWFAMQPPEPGHNTVADGKLDGSLDGDNSDNSSPLDSNAGSNTGNGAGTTGTGDSNDPAHKTNTGTDPNNPDSTDPEDPDAVDPDVEQPEDPAKKVEWKAHSLEATISGRVTMKSDDRPAVGATVSIELADLNTPTLGFDGEDRAIEPGVEPIKKKPESPSRPATEVMGSATTDGAGEFSIVVTLKFWGPKNVESPEMDSTAWVRYAEMVVAVARMTGYAPGRSAPIKLKPKSEETVNLTLAVPASLRGRVVDSVTKEGIAGANGTLTDMDSVTSRGGSVPISFVTDANGEFSITSMPSGTYILSLSASGYVDFNGWQGRGPGRINLKGSEEKNLSDILMTKSTNLIGRIVDAETGEPVASAKVELRKSQQFGMFTSNSAVSDSDGTFQISTVNPGSYSLRVQASDYAMKVIETLTVEVGSEHDAGDIQLDRGLTLTGVVTGPDNEALEGVEVTLNEPPSGSFQFNRRDNSIASAVSDEKGNFELRGINEGKWSLGAKLKEFAPYSELIEVSTRPETLKIKMSRGGSIRGRVLDADGNPAKDVSLAATSHETGSYAMFKTQPATMIGLMRQQAVSSTKCDELGRFTIPNVPAGTYVVTSSGMGSREVWKDDVEVKDSRETDIGDLSPPAPGKLQVTVTEEGAPVSDVEIRLSAGMFMGSGQVMGVTDNSGTVLIDPVPEGTWYVRTSRDQSQFDTDMSARRVVVKAGETTAFPLELRPKEGVYLHGRLTMNGKAIINDIIVIGLGDRSDVVKSIKPVEGGYYEVIGLKTGSYILHVRESDKQVPAKVKLDLMEEGEREFNRDFRGYMVSGSVLTPDDSPAQRSSVSVSITHVNPERPDFNAWLKGATVCDSDGKFEFNNVTSGVYQVTASLAGVGSAKTQVTIQNSDSGQLSIEITQNSGSIKVTVSKLNGTPVAGGGFAMVTVLDSDGNTVDLGEDFQGFFVLSEGATQSVPNVPAGTFSMLIRGSGYIQKTLEGIVVENGKATDVDAELTAAAELHLTVTNPDIDQAALDAASVRYYDANGTELVKDNNPFDSMTGTAAPEVPTLIAKYIGPDVSEVRIKLAGYAEITVPVTFAQGKKIEKQESLLAE